MKLPAFTNDTGMIMVKLSDSLWVSAYETTQEDYRKITGSNPSKFQGPRNPVETVSWNEAMDFCARLTTAEAACQERIGEIGHQGPPGAPHE